MAKACCVDGCLAKDDVFFRFPNSRMLHKKWMEALKLTTKPGHNSVLCRAHFKPDDYSLVRGKVRLKAKVIPCLHNNEQLKTNNTPQNNLTDSEEDRLRQNKEQDEEEKQNSNNNVDTDIKEPIGNGEYSVNKQKENGRVQTTSRSRKRKSKTEMAKGVPNKKKKNKKTHKGGTETMEPPAAEVAEKEDVEELLTYFHIKQNKNVAERQNAELEKERKQNGGGDGGEVIDLSAYTEPNPVFIEVSVDKDKPEEGRSGSPQDCLMVMESVQVELDPNDVLPLEPDDDDQDHVAISLLTSSDDDDVIIQEPHIDTVEISDESNTDVAAAKRARKGLPKARKRARPGRRRRRATTK